MPEIAKIVPSNRGLGMSAGVAPLRMSLVLAAAPPTPAMNSRRRIGRSPKSWLGHVSLDTTNHYAQANLETKRKALERLEPSSKTRRLWLPKTPSELETRKSCLHADTLCRRN